MSQPATRIDVPATRGYATQTRQDSMNMNQYTDLGWWNYAKDAPRSNLTGVSIEDPSTGATTSARPSGSRTICAR